MYNGFFGSIFDYDGNGVLDPSEQALDMMAFTEMIVGDCSTRQEAIDALACVGINVDDASVTDLEVILDDMGFGEITC